MVREALTGYWSLVSGLTEVTGKRARKAAKALVEQGDAGRGQLTALAQEIAETSRANREALVKLVRYEAERAAGRLGFASADDVSTLQGRVRELERSIAELRATTATPATSAVPSATPAPVAPGSAAKAPARARAAKASAADKAAPVQAPARATRTTKSTKSTKSTKATRTAAAKATPRKRTADAAGGDGPGSPS